MGKRHKNAIPLELACETFVDDLRLKSEDPRLRGLPIPLRTLSREMRQLRIGELTVLGGFEGHGKSALAQQIAFGVAKSLLHDESFLDEEDDYRQRAVLYCSLEMSTEQLIGRAITQASGLSPVRLYEPDSMGREDWKTVETYAATIARWPLLLADSPLLDTAELEEILRTTDTGYDVRFIVVDYLQLLSDPVPPSKDGEVQRLDNIAKSLKNMALRYKCHILALSSLNRDMRPEDIFPTAKNLRGSGGLQYAADNILLLTIPRKQDHSLAAKWGEYGLLRIDKQRSGSTGELLFRWRKDYLKFEDLSDQEMGSLFKELPRKRY